MARASSITVTFDKQSTSLCARCRRAFDREYAVLTGGNRCFWCQHPVLQHTDLLAAAKALVRLYPSWVEARVHIGELIAEQDRRSKGASP